MGRILTDTDSWLIAILLAVSMLAAWFIGYARGKRIPDDERPKIDSTFSGAAMALLGLLLGFTFSMSLTKHETRRQMVVVDANAIGDFYTCVSLVKEPPRAELQKLVVDYAEKRLKTVKEPVTEETFLAFQKAHVRMQELVGQALDAGTPIAVPLANTLNALTSSHQARVASALDRLPPSIILLLAFASVVTMALIGTHRGAAGEHWHGGPTWFVVLVSLVVWVILDLNQPRQGMITVSQEPMERVLRGMK